MQKLEYGLSGVGLGTNIGFMSALIDSGIPSCIHVDSKNHLMLQLKRIFNVSDDCITVTVDPDYPENITAQLGDQLKFFSPYLAVDSIQAFDQQWPIVSTPKPAIGLAMFHVSNPGENVDNRYPHSKLYSREVYARIFNLIVASGYDVITFNSEHIDVEHKIWQLNQLCECVVGYEGGIAHLAHVLKIPCFILPYHHSGDGARPLWADDGLLDVNLMHGTQLLHVDRRTYFLSSPREIANWTPAQFRDKIQDLKDSKGNHVLFGPGITVKEDMLQVSTEVPGLDNMTPWLSYFEFQFVTKYIKRRNFD
jgi:hypothetical protein